MTPTTCAVCRAQMPGANAQRRTCSDRCRKAASTYRRTGVMPRRMPPPIDY